jgi:hypothetical protein
MAPGAPALDANGGTVSMVLKWAGRGYAELSRSTGDGPRVEGLHQMQADMQDGLLVATPNAMVYANTSDWSRSGLLGNGRSGWDGGPGYRFGHNCVPVKQLMPFKLPEVARHDGRALQQQLLSLAEPWYQQHAAPQVIAALRTAAKRQLALRLDSCGYSAAEPGFSRFSAMQQVGSGAADRATAS